MKFIKEAARFGAVCFGAGLFYSLLEPYRLAVREYSVCLPDLPGEVEGLRIAQLSDLHCSAITSRTILECAVATCNRLKPDVVALTGDFVSRRNSYASFTGARKFARPVMDYASQVAQILGGLCAPDGVFATPGNHDHSRGNQDAVMDLLRARKIDVLVNESTLLRGVLPIVGLDDLRGGNPDLGEAFAHIPNDKAQVVLSHNPRLVASITNRNCLMLAGHTHAGQVRLPLLPIEVKPSDMQSSPFLGGWYQQGKAQLYVNNGLGSVHFPMRFRRPPEISVFTLRSK